MRQLGELLDLDRITVSLAVDTRTDALDALAASLARDCELDTETIRAALEAREELGSTNLGVGVAVPHARVPGIRGTKVAVAICPGGVSYDASEPEPVRILIALLTDDGDPRMGLDALASVVHALKQETVRAEVQCARSAERVLEVLKSDVAEALEPRRAAHRR